MIKIPKSAVENFITSEMKYKRCKENEFQICSLYVQDAKYKCYINTEMFVFCDFKAGVSGSCYSLFRDFLNLESNKEVLIYIMKNYAYNEFLTIENKINEIKTNENIINDFNEIDKPIYFFQNFCTIALIEYLTILCILPFQKGWHIEIEGLLSTS